MSFVLRTEVVRCKAFRQVSISISYLGIKDMGYDAKHSFEDAIMPVEEAYDRWGGRIAILGGIDVDFVCRASIDEIKQHCRAMLERTKNTGGYALGTGNSIPEYVPNEKYFAMISMALEG